MDVIVENPEKVTSAEIIAGTPSCEEAEEYLENMSRVFEGEKYYLIKRWDADQKKLGQKLFKA